MRKRTSPALCSASGTEEIALAAPSVLATQMSVAAAAGYTLKRSRGRPNARK
jgi:hypothetical protein